MVTPQEQRKIRMKNDYEEMKNIRGPIVQWRPLDGEPPYVEVYELTVNVRTIIGPEPNYRNTHKLEVTLPTDYPSSAPSIVMETSPLPYHPNWWPSGIWCSGAWDISEGLGHHVVRMIRTLQFDSEITNPDNPANDSAKDWYLAHQDRGWFPCDSQVLPDPTKPKFKIIQRARKKFDIH